MALPLREAELSPRVERPVQATNLQTDLPQYEPGEPVARPDADRAGRLVVAVDVPINGV